MPCSAYTVLICGVWCATLHWLPYSLTATTLQTQRYNYKPCYTCSSTWHCVTLSASISRLVLDLCHTPSSHHKMFVLPGPTLGKSYSIAYRKRVPRHTQPLAQILCMQLLWSELGVDICHTILAPNRPNCNYAIIGSESSVMCNYCDPNWLVDRHGVTVLPPCTPGGVSRGE